MGITEIAKLLLFLFFAALHHLRHLPVHLRYAVLNDDHEFLIELYFKGDFDFAFLLFNHSTTSLTLWNAWVIREQKSGEPVFR